MGNHGCAEILILLLMAGATVAQNGSPGRPRDCADIKIVGRSSPNGVYLIYPDGDDAIPITVYCDMETENGGWTVIQRRMDGSVDFYRYWADYKSGFGNVSSEHWLGNDKIHFLSRQKTYELRIDLEDFDGQKSFATYSNFSVANETTNYELSRVDNFAGNAGDCLSYHAGRPFSTRDRDNDISPHEWENCADRYKGGWWYHACHYANLNGQYGEKRSAAKTSHGVVWYDWATGGGLPYTLRKTEMKIRQTNYLTDLSAPTVTPTTDITMTSSATVNGTVSTMPYLSAPTVTPTTDISMTSSATVNGTVSTMPFQTTCSRPQPRFGTRYNGTMTIYYSPGDVLEIKCDTGFKVTFEPPTITCMDGGHWKPSNVSCEINSGNPNRLAEPKTIGGAVGAVCLVVLLIVIIIIVAVRRRKRHPVKTLHGDKELDDPYMDLVPTASPSSPYETLGTGAMGEALGNMYENGPVAMQCQYANQIQNQDQHTYDFI